jgi:hypothetical protein
MKKEEWKNKINEINKVNQMNIVKMELLLHL